MSHIRPSSEQDRQDRAQDVFKAYLDRKDCDPQTFAEVLEKNPDLEELLEDIRAGLEFAEATFRSLHPTNVLQADPMDQDVSDPPRRARALNGPRLARPSVLLVAMASAAATILAMAVLAHRAFNDGDSLPLLVAAVPPFLASVDTMDSVYGVVCASSFMSWYEAQFGATESAEESLGKGITALYERTCEAVREFNDLPVIDNGTRASVLAKCAAHLSRFGENLTRTAKGRKLLASVRKDPPPFWERLDLALAFSEMLQQTGEIPRISYSDRQLNEDPASAITSVERLLELARRSGHLSLRAIDLDARGVEIDGAEVYAQDVRLDTGLVGEPIFLGTSPLEHRLGPGDWRITVQDRVNRRHSELRVLVVPGEPLAAQVAFLRSSTEVTGSMVWLPSCSFLYGARARASATLSPRERTETSRGFWMDPFEATNEEYEKFLRDVREHPEWFGRREEQRSPLYFLDGDKLAFPHLARHPVARVTWFGAALYANWVGKRLPTDREWERAARGDLTENRSYPWGESVEDLGQRVDLSYEWEEDPGTGFLRAASVREDEGEVHSGPMDAFPRDVTPNGIFCLAGNVSEWVEDTALFYIKRSGNPGLIDPRAFGRYNRGSSWKSNSAENCKVSEAARGWLNPRALVNDVGFRCVKSPYPDFSRN